MQATFACPTCDKLNMSSPLVSSTRGFTCGAGHVFNDSEELLSMHPRTLASTNMVKPREGMVTYNASLPGKLVIALQQKFGDKLAGAMECILTAMLDVGSFIVTGFDAQRLQQHLGKPIKDTSTLVGLVASQKMDLLALKKEMEAYRSAGAAQSTNEVQGDFVQVTLRLPLEEFLKIKAKAEFNSLPPATHLQHVISHALSNEWI